MLILLHNYMFSQFTTCSWIILNRVTCLGVPVSPSVPPAGQHLKKDSLSESSSDIVELEEGVLLSHELSKKQNCNPRHNNNINAMSIETDV